METTSFGQIASFPYCEEGSNNNEGQFIVCFMHRPVKIILEYIYFVLCVRMCVCLLCLSVCMCTICNQDPGKVRRDP